MSFQATTVANAAPAQPSYLPSITRLPNNAVQGMKGQFHTYGANFTALV